MYEVWDSSFYFTYEVCVRARMRMRVHACVHISHCKVLWQPPWLTSLASHTSIKTQDKMSCGNSLTLFSVKDVFLPL